MGQKIEYDIVEHCNLNCRNCGHFSQFKSKEEKSIEDVQKEISLLTSRLPIDNFRITGGEPLIHSDINGVLLILRNVLGKDCKIVLVTNGIKLNSIDDTFYVIVKSCNIIVEISAYPIGVDYEKVQQKLREKEIRYTISDKLSFYNFIDPTGQQDAKESLELCRKEFYCPFFDGEYIYLCAYVKNVPFANERFGYKIEYDRISVTEPQEAIVKYLTTPCPTCRFCKSTRQPESWQRELNTTK